MSRGRAGRPQQAEPRSRREDNGWAPGGRPGHMEPGLGKTAPQAGAAPSKLDNRQFSSLGQIEEGIPQEAPPASDWPLLPTESRRGLSPQHRLQATNDHTVSKLASQPKPTRQPSPPPCRPSCGFRASCCSTLGTGGGFWTWCETRSL